MKILSLFCGLALLMFGVAASAHAHLQKSSPADNSVITTSPSHAHYFSTFSFSLTH